MITVRANARNATYISDDLITSGSVGIPVTFVLSEDFDGLSAIAVFEGSGTARDVALIGNTCVVPHEVVATAGGYLRVGIYASNAEGTIVIPTVWAGNKMILQGTEPSELDPSEPTPSWAAQVQAAAAEAVQTSEEAIEIAGGAEAAAEEARQSASAAAASATEAGQSANAAGTAQAAAEEASDEAASARDAAVAAQGSAASSAQAAAGSATAAAASEAAAREVKESIPQDYTALSENVSDLKSQTDDFVETFGINLTDPNGTNHRNLGTLPHTVNISKLEGYTFGDPMIADGLNIFDFSGLSAKTEKGVTITPLANNAFILNGTATGVSLANFKVITDDADMLVTEGEKVAIRVWTTAPIRILVRTQKDEYNTRELRDFSTSIVGSIVTSNGTTAVAPIIGYNITFASTAGTVFNNDIVWLGVYHEGTTFDMVGEIANLPLSVETKMQTLNTMYYMSSVNYVAKTKKYVDALDVDINDKLTYVTPEKFYGGMIPTTVDAAPYILQAITYGVDNGVAVRCNQTYYTATMLDLQCSYLSLYIHELIYSGSEDYAIRLTGRWNNIICDMLQSSTSGICLYARGSNSGQYNQSNIIRIGRTQATVHGIVLSKPDGISVVGGLNSFNEITCRYINVNTGNAVRIEVNSGGNENVFNGGVLDVASNYAIWDEYGSNEFNNFSFESNTYQGMYFAAGGDVFVNSRTAECENACAIAGRAFIKLVGDSLRNIRFLGKGAPSPQSIDVSELEIPPENKGAGTPEGYLYWLIVSQPVIYAEVYSSKSKSSYYASAAKYYASAGSWAINIAGDIIFRLSKPSEIEIADATYDLDRSTEYNRFIVGTVNSAIALSHSYCADGIDEIYVEQRNGYIATVTDAYGNVVFDGTGLGDGLYRINFVAQLVPYTPSTETRYTWFFGRGSKAVVSRVDTIE